MHKAFLLILCLLVNTTMVVAQQPDTRRRAPRPVGQDVSPIISGLTEEQLERGRRFALEILIRNYFEGQRTRAQSAVPPPDQHSWAPPPPLGGFPDFTQDPDLRKYGPFGPNINKGLGPLGEEQGVQPSGNVLPNLGNVVNVTKGFTHPLDGFSLDLNLEGFEERIDAGTDGAIGALNLMKQAAASNQPPVPGPASGSVMTRNTEGVTALAASRSPKLPKECKTPQTPAPDVRCVIDPHGVYVRIDPGSFFVNTLKLGDHFRVKARRDILKVDPKTGKKHNVCYFYGDALGGLDLHNVWVICDGLEEQGDKHPTPRPAVEPEFHKPGPFNPKDTIVTTRDNLYDRFAAPATFPETPKGNDGRATAEVKLEVGSTQVFRKYNPSKRNDPITHGFSDPITTVFADPKISPNITLKVRYLREGAQAVVVDYVVTNPNGTKSKKWAFVKYGEVNIILPPGPRWP